MGDEDELGKRAVGCTCCGHGNDTAGCGDAAPRDLREWGEGWVKKEWTPAPELLNSDGSLFGGYIAALADQALAFAAMTMLVPDAAFRTINLQVNFIRVGRAHPLLIEAHVVATTKKLITVRADFHKNDGKLIAEASAQQLVAPFGT